MPVKGRLIFHIWGESTQVPILASMADGSIVGTFLSVRWMWEEDGKLTDALPRWNRKLMQCWVTRSTDGGHTWSQPVKTPYTMGPWNAVGGEEFLGVNRFPYDPEKCGRVPDSSEMKMAVKLMRIRFKNDQWEFDDLVTVSPVGDAAGPPSLTRTLDGKLACAYSVYPPSANGRSYVALRISADEGHTWGEERVVDPIECGASGKSYHVIVQVPDGALTVFSTEHRPQPFMRKSYDEGRTWSERRPINPFRSPFNGRPYPYSKLIQAVTLGEWGGEWYTDILCEGRAADRRVDDAGGGLVTAHSYDGGYTWEETQIIDECEWPPDLSDRLRSRVGGVNSGYGSLIRLEDKVLLASSNLDAENLRQGCFLYEVPGLITPATKHTPALQEAPGLFGKDAGGR